MCFHCVFGFSVFRFFGFSVLSARQKVCVPKIGFGWSARKSVYLKSGLAGQKVCVPKIGFGWSPRKSVYLKSVLAGPPESRGPKKRVWLFQKKKKQTKSLPNPGRMEWGNGGGRVTLPGY